MSFGHPEHCLLTVWTPKSLGQDLLMMTILEDSACSVTSLDTQNTVFWTPKTLCQNDDFSEKIEDVESVVSLL